MHEILEQVSGYVRGVWRFRWYIQLIAWPLCLAGWALVSWLPDQYEAKAQVYVDTDSMLRPVLKGLAVEPNIDEKVRMITQTLMSRPNLEKIARMTDMDLQAESDADMEKIVERLSQTITIQGAKLANLYTISYTDNIPERAKTTVQSLLTILIESSLGDSRKDSDLAQRFLDDQIREYERRLTEAEDRLKEFKRENVGLMPSEGRGYYEHLQAAQEQLGEARLSLKEAQNRRDELKRQLAGEEPTFGLFSGGGETTSNVAHPLDARIETLQERLDDLLLRYTENHPDVITIKETITRLRKKKEEEIAASGITTGISTTPGLETNPVYQQLKISLGQAEADVASMQVRVEEYTARVERLEGLVNSRPQVEAELVRLNRDYAINKKNYEELLVRRESLKLSQQMEQTSDDVKFRVVDPPRVPSEPVGPNRPLFAAAVLVLGISIGTAFALFMSQVRPTFDSTRHLGTTVGLPVLGSVSMVWTPRQRKVRIVEIASFGVAGLVLLGVFAVLLVLYLNGVRLFVHAGAGGLL